MKFHSISHIFGVLCFFLLTCTLCNGFKALVAIPGTIKSLHSLFSQIVLVLADAGHNITFITSFPLQGEHKNVEVIETYLLSEANVFELANPANVPKVAARMQEEYIEKTWSDPEIWKQWEKRKEFDLFVFTSNYNEFLFPFLMDSEGVFVQMCTPGFELVSLTREGNWLVPSAVPSIVTTYDDNMSFMERSRNLAAAIHYYLFQKTVIKSKQGALNAIFPGLLNLESYYDRVALTLINGNYALDSPVPLLPSQIEIGTITARKPQPLSKDLLKFVEGSKEAGVIYFSLGSIAKSAHIPIAAKGAFVEAFRRLPQRVIWKYEGDDLELPPNVMTKSWLPQQDILGHPKTRVFISHCGNIGSQEAKYHGIPVLGIPIAFDQPRNCARMERKGLAIVLRWEDLTAEKIVDSLLELMNNTLYKERVECLSRILQDQRESPAEKALWWLEYVVRHKGAPHLQYAGMRLTLFQYLMLDVILVWTGAGFASLILVFCFIRCVCCRRSKKREKVKKA